MLINDKSQLKRNVEQIGFQLALKLARVSADLTDYTNSQYTAAAAAATTTSSTTTIASASLSEPSPPNTPMEAHHEHSF